MPDQFMRPAFRMCYNVFTSVPQSSRIGLHDLFIDGIQNLAKSRARLQTERDGKGRRSLNESENLVAQASSGDGAAFKKLCDRWLSHDIERQFETQEAILASTNADFWSGVIEFICDFTWQGAELTGITHDRATRGHLVAKFTNLIERSPNRRGPIHPAAVDQALSASVKSESGDIRRLAAQIAGERRSESCLPQIEALLNDPETTVREAAARAFGQLAPKGQLKQLASTLTDENPGVRLRARQELAAAGHSAIPALVETLSSNDPLVRWEATRALADMRNSGTIDALVQSLHDADWIVCQAASDGLAQLGIEGARSVLGLLVRDSSDWTIRHEAFHALRQLVHQPELSAALNPVLDALQKSEPEIAVPIAAEAALGMLRT